MGVSTNAKQIPVGDFVATLMAIPVLMYARILRFPGKPV